MQSIFFTTMFTTYNTSLMTASQTVANNLLSISGPQLTGAITLVIVVIGVMMLFHKMTLADGTLWVVKAIMIASILSTGMYTQYVPDHVLDDDPEHDRLDDRHCGIGSDRAAAIRSPP